MQMGFGLVSRDQKRKQQIDRLIVDGIKCDRSLQLDKHANGAQRILFKFTVRNGNPVANPGTAHFLAGKDRLKHHLRRQT